VLLCNFAGKIFPGGEAVISLFLLAFFEGVGGMSMFLDGNLLVRLWSFGGELWTGNAS
jgi:hypothetical protein